jgi:hypothetical protein
MNMRMSAPVYPKHNGDTRFPRQTPGTSDVQVETLGFDLLEVWRRGLGAGQGKQFFFNTLALRLRTDGPG